MLFQVAVAHVTLAMGWVCIRAMGPTAAVQTVGVGRGLAIAKIGTVTATTNASEKKAEMF